MMSEGRPQLGVLFDIDQLVGGTYGGRAWRFFMSHLDPTKLGGGMLFHGDTAATLQGRARLFCIALHADEAALGYVEGVFASLPTEGGLLPLAERFVRPPALTGEPLPLRGRVDHEGRLVTEDWDRPTHDQCKDSSWGYAPERAPQDLPPDLADELEELRRPRRTGGD